MIPDIKNFCRFHDGRTSQDDEMVFRDENGWNKFRSFSDRIPFFRPFLKWSEFFQNRIRNDLGLVGIRIGNDLGRIPTKFHITIFSLKLFYITIFKIIQKSE
jgi:hypothetical protein